MADLHVIERPDPAEDVIAYCERLLQRARHGELSAIACAYLYRDGTTGHGHTDLKQLQLMAGTVAGLLADLTRSMLP